MELNIILEYFTPVRLVLCVSVCYVLSSIISWYRLRHVDGPWVASFSYFFMLQTQISGRAWDVYAELNQQYGPLVRIGPNELMTDDPELIRRLAADAGSNDDRLARAAGQSQGPHDDSSLKHVDASFQEETPTHGHTTDREKGGDRIEKRADAQIRNLIDQVRRSYVARSKRIWAGEFGMLVKILELDTVPGAADSSRLATISERADYTKELSMALSPIQMGIDIPLLHRLALTPIYLGLRGPRLTEVESVGVILSFAKGLIKRRNGTDDPWEASNPTGASLRGARATVSSCVDTTTRNIWLILVQILSTQSVYSSLKMEIASAIKAGYISNPVTHEEASKLPYLQAVILEGHRLYAPFACLTSENMIVVPNGGITIHERVIPTGTRIGRNIWGVFHQESIFGPDVDQFCPGRFLEVSTARRTLMEKTLDLASCKGCEDPQGRSLATMYLNKILVQLLRKFDIETAYPSRPWSEVDHRLFVEQEIWFRITEVEH